MKLLIHLSFVILYIASYGQTEPINQFDAEGHKTGVWIEYLDSTKWKILADSLNASSARYTFFERDLNLFTEFYYGRTKLVRCDSLSQNNHSMMLNGEYKWYDKKKPQR